MKLVSLCFRIPICVFEYTENGEMLLMKNIIGNLFVSKFNQVVNILPLKLHQKFAAIHKKIPGGVGKTAGRYTCICVIGADIFQITWVVGV